MEREKGKLPVSDLQQPGEAQKGLPVGALTPGKDQKQTAPRTADTQGTAMLRRKRILVGLALVFFLFSIIFIVPAGRVPLIRNLAWMMGFSAEDTQSISFARALLTWAGAADRTSGSWSGDDGAVSLFDRNKKQGFNASGPQSGLFDLDRLNAARAARGLPPEGLAGAGSGVQTQDGAAVNQPVNGWSEQAKREQAAKGGKEVYFGADANLASRAAMQNRLTKGSSDTLSLVPRAGIAGAAATDWLGQAADKASLLSNARMDEELRKISQTAAPLSNLGGKLKSGQRPQRDLATVWLMSKAADKAPQLMLKKTLASSGFLAIEMPKKVYDSSGESAGVRVSGEELSVSFESANQALLAEEKCRDIASNSSTVVQPKLEESKKLITRLPSVPKSCGADMQTWSANLRSIKANCNEIKTVFDNMQSFCGAQIKQGRCETARLDSYESSYNEICEGYENLSEEEKALREGRLAQAAKDIDYEVRDSFNLSVDGQDGGGNDFFPQTEGVKI